MKFRYVSVALSLAIFHFANFSTAAASDLEKYCAPAIASFGTLLDDSTKIPNIKFALVAQTKALANPAWLPGYCRALQDNIADKVKSKSEGTRFDDKTLINTAINYEAYRITAFRNAGVSPKRFFGFLDEKGKTAAYETKLKYVATKISALLKSYTKKNGLSIRVTPKEIIVTHLAEGGALLLTDNFDKVDEVHPVFGIGLDDFRIGFVRFPGLMAEVDKSFGTNLSRLANAKASSVTATQSILGNVATYLYDKNGRMTFTESILGTAVMYLYEKEIAEKKRLADHRPSLQTLSLDEQYVQSSLVYNSGILFSDDRVRQMMAFDTGAYLVDTSNHSQPKRSALPVIMPADADTLLANGSQTQIQTTTWNAVYHVMRYGAWVALSKFSNNFTKSGDVVPLKPKA
jgi:hypothetical protein